MMKVSKKIAIGALCLFLFVAFCLSGCGRLLSVGVRSLSFSQDEKELYVGERIELNQYITISPSKATDKSFAVTSDNENIVHIETVSDGGTVSKVYANAIGVGTAVLTATSPSGKSDNMTVTVRYAQPSGITVCVDGGHTVIGNTVVLHSDAIATVQMRSELNHGVAPDCTVLWTATDGVNTQSETLTAGEPFSVTPAGAGSTVVTAKVSDGDGRTFSDTVTVNVYDELRDVSVTYDEGALNQEAGQYETVRFDLACELPEGNPNPIVRWFVNGEQQGTGTAFDFLPQSSGVYAVTVNINGKAWGESAIATVYVRGEIVPQNVRIEYDNCYPSVWIVWDTIPAAAGYEVRITDVSTGGVISDDLSTDNTSLRDKFTSYGFDATAYLSGSRTLFNTRFSVKVRTLGDKNGILLDSDWSDEYVTELIPARAKSYLADTFYDGARNRYVTSYEEFYEWFEYAMLWRPVSLSSGEKLYLDYSFVSALDEIERAMGQMSFTGSYSYSGTSDVRNRKECTFSVLFETDGAPSRKTTAHTGEAWNALRPHVNYDLGKVRPNRYVFAIDTKTPVTVETSDQLYYVTQLGYCPVPRAGSVAEKLYNYARRTLRYIITDDMTDVEKLHAIYDWIVWRVTYDDEVLAYTDIARSVQFESYYLESVFTDTSAYGVCDAMSKAFVLLCGIEGFECLRVAGVAGSGSDKGGHAWNKVKLDGEWYVVDCTWGDAKLSLRTDGIYKESASHLYFLVSDAEVSDTHVEKKEAKYPASAAKRYPWYQLPVAAGGGTYVPHIDGTLSASALRNALNAMIPLMIREAAGAQHTFSVGPDPILNRSYADYVGFEIVVDMPYDKISSTELRLVLTEVLKANGAGSGDYRLNLQAMGKTTHILLFLRIGA